MKGYPQESKILEGTRHLMTSFNGIPPAIADSVIPWINYLMLNYTNYLLVHWYANHQQQQQTRVALKTPFFFKVNSGKNVQCE